MNSDLATAFRLTDIADQVTLRWWHPTGVRSRAKVDGSPVTEADVAAEEALLRAVRDACPGDGFLGEEIGERGGTTGRR
jgi:fructose-1,6-bisphosphatase/inositol monophosphatase family enzyme